MEYIYLGIRVVFPLMSFMLVGFLVRKLGWLEDDSFTRLNTLVFRLLMPLMVFLNGSTANRQDMFNRENLYVLFLVLVGVAVVFFTALLVCGRCIADIARRAIMVQAIFRSNLILFGLPIVVTIYDESAMGLVALLIIFVVPLYNIIAAFLLGNVVNNGKNFGKVFWQAFSNPLVLAAVLGVLYNFIFDGAMSTIILEPIQQLSRTSTPLAFIVLGGSLRFASMAKEKKSMILLCSLRLVIIPAIMMFIAITLGVTGAPLAVLLAVFASPVAVLSYTMAKEMKVAPELAGNFVAITTTFSLLTVCLWVSMLSLFGLL